VKLGKKEVRQHERDFGFNFNSEDFNEKMQAFNDKMKDFHVDMSNMNFRSEHSRHRAGGAA